MWLGGVVVRALDLRLKIASSIPATALSSATSDQLFTHVPLSPSSIMWYQRKLGSTQAHRATHWSRVHGLAASANVCLRANKSEIRAAHGARGSGRTLLLLFMRYK